MNLLRPFVLVLAGAALGALLTAQCEVQTLLPPGPEAGFGRLVAQDGASFAVASVASVYVYEQVGRTAYLQERLDIPELDSRTFLRSLALDGDTLAISIDSFDFLPSVRVFERQAGAWSEVSRLTHGVRADDFGRSLALDGERLAVGAPGEGSPGANFAGAVHLYERQAGAWTPVERLAPQRVRSTELFGSSLDLEGDRLAVGAPLAFSHQQSAYVFDKTSSGWQESVLTPANPITAVLGAVLDLRGDALIVGDPSAATGEGRAWVFEHDAAGWSETAELTHAGAPMFGYARAVALSEDGKLALVNSQMDAIPTSAGALEVFEKVAGTWQRGEKIEPSRPTFGGAFGKGVSCEGDLALVLARDSVTTVSVRETLCRTLFAQPDEISLTQGGRQTLRLNPGPEFAGRRFLLLGSASGFDPGFTFLGARVPLVRDGYFRLSLPGQRRPPFVNNSGVLGAEPPQAEVTIDVPPGTDLALAGLQLTHAFVVLDHGVLHVSNARTLELVP